MYKVFTLIVSVSFVVASCYKGTQNPESCNGEGTRREVKLCIDSLSSGINMTPVNIDVKSFGEIEVPKIDENTPRQLIEKQVYTITAKVHKLSKHWDGDYKVKLTNDQDLFVNCENPNPGCSLLEDSPFLSECEVVREWIQANKKGLEGKTVTITGVAFIDVDHNYPRNAAPNNLELHPILDIHY